MKKFLLIISIIMLIFIDTKFSIINICIGSLAVIILAVILGKLTSNMSFYVGEKKGGMLAATIGNIPELMMAFSSVKYGMILMAKSALMGSIISNMLLGLGISVFCGGIKYKEQKFNKIIARTNFNMLILAMSAIVIISALSIYSVPPLKEATILSINVKISLVLICIYLLGIVFSFYTHKDLFLVSDGNVEEKLCLNKIKKISSIGMLVLISILLYFSSDKLILNIKNIVETKNVSQQFVGIILIPFLGNIGENASSIICAMDNKINMSLETAIGSSIQISLFVTPLIMIMSCNLAHPMTLVFTSFEIIISILAIGMSFLVFQDGKSYWFEGAILIAIYIIITIAYYYICY
ncbi:calcium/proton exchanger [Haloimpatiens sp. FM7315]|uniref:calcium/proton exchanger n=1 Tax=Haloimpatiens sp. FM7315 TaxID=3298609 RepID=UPI00370BC199